MKCKLSKITKVEIETLILPFIPQAKRGYPSKINPVEIVQCIIHKLKTGCQWHCLFIDTVGYKPVCSWQLVYYFYRRWSQCGVFENLFKTLLIRSDTTTVSWMN